MNGDSTRYAMHAKKAEARRRAMKKTSMTATDTGARLNAIKNYNKKPSLGSFVKKASLSPTPKGATPQFRETSDKDIERMIKGGN